MRKADYELRTQKSGLRTQDSELRMKDIETLTLCSQS